MHNESLSEFVRLPNESVKSKRKYDFPFGTTRSIAQLKGAQAIKFFKPASLREEPQRWKGSLPTEPLTVEQKCNAIQKLS